MNEKGLKALAPAMLRELLAAIRKTLGGEGELTSGAPYGRQRIQTAVGM